VTEDGSRTKTSRSERKWGNESMRGSDATIANATTGLTPSVLVSRFFQRKKLKAQLFMPFTQITQYIYQRQRSKCL